MDYGGPSDSSGTDDDLPPSHHNRMVRGNRVAGNGRAPILGGFPHNSRAHTDMETEIHSLEKDAYSSVLRAFKAQSDALTWEKESLITELRKELRVSDDEHRELLSIVNANEILRRIREWRQGTGGQNAILNAPQANRDVGPGPTVSASRKKPRTSQTNTSSALGAPPPILHQDFGGTLTPSPALAKKGAGGGSKGKKAKSGQMAAGSLSHHPAGVTVPNQIANHASSGPVTADDRKKASTFSTLIGRKVRTRWPEDNSFYEAVISDYNPITDAHHLVYDVNKPNETWEWVNLKEIAPEDIRWDGEDPGISRKAGRSAPGRGSKKSTSRGNPIQGAGRGRGPATHSKKEFPALQNGVKRKAVDDIEILHTETLVTEVERVLNSTHPDPLDLDKAKKVLKEHEEALMDAIERLGDPSEGESDGDHPFSHGRSVDGDPAFG